jgi:HK97 family phage major capsid protein
MSKPETTSRGGEALPDALTPADEVKSALAGLVGDITERLQKQEERLTMLDRKNTLSPSRRPALAAAHEAEAPHQKAFEAYLRTGEDDALRGLPLEGKAMSTAVAADGGYLVDPQTSDMIRSMVGVEVSTLEEVSVAQPAPASVESISTSNDVPSTFTTLATCRIDEAPRRTLLTVSAVWGSTR